MLSTLALAGVVRALAPEMEAAHGIRIDAKFMPTAVLMPRLRAHEPADAVLLTEEGVAALVAEGLLLPGSQLDLARSFVGVAVQAGAPHPDISAPEAFVAALDAARSVCLSKQGASGLFLAGLLRRLGIAEAIGAKATVIESGFTAELAARGEVELALQQVSELMVVPGVEIVGRLPAALGGDGVFSGGVMAASARPDMARSVLSMIAGARDLLVEKGLEPV
jgi:molybdate transport system substrate-binding protein